MNWEKFFEDNEGKIKSDLRSIFHRKKEREPDEQELKALFYDVCGKLIMKEIEPESKSEAFRRIGGFAKMACRKKSGLFIPLMNHREVDSTDVDPVVTLLDEEDPSRAVQMECIGIILQHIKFEGRDEHDLIHNLDCFAPYIAGAYGIDGKPRTVAAYARKTGKKLSKIQAAKDAIRDELLIKANVCYDESRKVWTNV